jgi:hypothetical protein
MPGESQAAVEGVAVAGAGAAVVALASASGLFDVAGFVGLPDFATFDAVAETLALAVPFAGAIGGAAAAGMIVGRVIMGAWAEGAARAGSSALDVATVDGCASGGATVAGCAFGAAAMVVVVVGTAVDALTGGVAGSAASRAASALPVVAGGADAAGAVLSLGLAGAVGVGEAL